MCDRSQLLGETVGRDTAVQPVVFVEHRCDDFEHVAVLPLLALDALKNGDIATAELPFEFDQAFPAELGRVLGIDVVPTELAERLRLQLLAKVGRELADKASRLGQTIDEQRTQRRGRTGHVVLQRRRPTCKPPGCLLNCRPYQPGNRSIAADEGAADQSGVGLFIAPDLHERVPHHFDDIAWGDQIVEPFAEDVLAIGVRDELLAFEGQHRQPLELARRVVGERLPQLGQELLALGENFPAFDVATGHRCKLTIA